MLRKSLLTLSLIGFGCIAPSARAADVATAPIEWISDRAVITLEVTQPKALFDVALDPKYEGAVADLPFVKAFGVQGKLQQMQGGVAYLSSQLGTDWKTALQKLIGGGITAAVAPQGEMVVIVESTDEAMLKKFHDVLHDIIEQKNPDQVKSTECAGGTVWSFGPQEAHAIVGNRLVFSNKAEAVRAVLEQRAKSSGGSIATSSDYRAARSAVGADSAATMFVNLAMLKQAPGLLKTFVQPTNPLGALLFGDLARSLHDARWLALGLQTKAGGITLRAATDSKSGSAAGPWAFAQPSAGAGALPNLVVPRQLAALSVYRDLHAFYAGKDQLFPERTSGLIFFENMMGIFFSGRDLTEEVLAETYPELRLVVAAQQYAAGAAPQVQFPAFAAVFHVRHPEKSGELMEEAWQKAVGLVNVTRGQRGMSGLIIDRDRYTDVKYSFAYFATNKEDEKDQLATRYNFRPSLARVEDFIILSSTEGLTKDLIDALKKEKAQAAQPMAGVHTLLEADGRQMATILRADEAVLVQRNMVEKGHTKEQAVAEVGVFTDIADRVGKIRLELGAPSAGNQATLEVCPNVK